MLNLGSLLTGRRENHDGNNPIQTLSPAVDEDLCQRLHSDIETMRDKFSTLQTMIRTDIGGNADHKALAAHVSGMYLPMTAEHEKQVASASTIDEIFCILPKYWSFLDFKKLENIANIFCSPDGEAKKLLEQYKHDVQQFCEHRVSKFPSGSLNSHLDIEGMDKLVVKLDLQDPLLKTVLHIKEVIATILQQPASKLVLCDIAPGCVIVTFWIATSLGEELFLKSLDAEILTQKQKEKLLEADVVSMEFKGTIVFGDPKGRNSGIAS